MLGRVSVLLCGLVVLSGCQYIRTEPGFLPRYSFDLNGNGMNDTNLELRPCSGISTATCLRVASTVTADKEIPISTGTNGCAGRIQGRRLEVIGDHVNDPLQEVAILYCENSGTGSPPALAIVDVSGYLQDLDADGWEDITLIYHTLVASVSTRTAAAIGTTEYDVAAAAEPHSPKWFHDGRNYGIHSAVMGTDGKLRTVIVGGMPVGGFENAMCGVSWFVAVLESLPDGPVPFDLREHPPGPLLARALSKGMWSERGKFPVAGRPKIRAVPGSGSRGYGSYTYFAELTLEDIDGDGLKDIQMADGTWAGYSTDLQGFVKKHAQDLGN